MYQELTIQLVESCNISCSYCFAPIKSDNKLSEENFNVFLDFCKKEKPDVIHITGGEPSLHPNFSSIINLLAEISSLVIYSNFTVAGIIDEIKETLADNIVFLINTNSKFFCSATELVSVQKNIEKALSKGCRIALSRTFFTNSRGLDKEFNELIEQLKCYNLNRLRISQSLDFNGTGKGLDRNQIRELYHYVANKILSWKEKGIKVYFDCPVPPCYIDPKDFNLLRKNDAVTIKCLPKVFVMWDLRVTHCYSTMDEPDCPRLMEFRDINSAKMFSERLLRKRQCQSNRNGCYNCKFGKDGIPCGCPTYCV